MSTVDLQVEPVSSWLGFQEAGLTRSLYDGALLRQRSTPSKTKRDRERETERERERETKAIIPTKSNKF